MYSLASGTIVSAGTSSPSEPGTQPVSSNISLALSKIVLASLANALLMVRFSCVGSTALGFAERSVMEYQAGAQEWHDRFAPFFDTRSLIKTLAERGSNEPWAYGVAANAPWTPFKSELTRKHRYPGLARTVSATHALRLPRSDRGNMH